jgi:hypothetical protein
MSHPPATDPAPADDEAFAALLAETMAHADRFGHRQHIHLTWLAIRRYSTRAAIALISDGIRRTTRYAGTPQKYHATVSRAWVELVGYHLTAGDEGGFDAFVDRHPALLDKRLLGRHYRSSTLATAKARTDWVEPDLEPLPGVAGPPEHDGRRPHP